MKKIWVYDTENLYDFHCSVFTDFNSDETRIFEISNFKNELSELKSFWKDEVAGVWGYNNFTYDDVLTTQILKKNSITANQIYQISQKIIDGKEKFWNNLPTKTADIFKLLHFDRFKVSLKWCEFGMGSDSIEELPIHWTESVTNREDADKVIHYCIYDVNQTKKVINKHPNELQLRRDFKSVYPEVKNPFILSNTAMGKEAMIFDYCKATGHSPEYIKSLRTERTNIQLKDIIQENIVFQTKHFEDFLTSIKNRKVNLVTSELNEYLYFQGMHYSLKKGGLHGVEGQKTKDKIDTRYIYESNEVDCLLDIDFGSFYPGILTSFNYSPEQLDKDIFVSLVKSYTEERLKHKALGNKKEAENLKIKINSLYGCLGDKHAFLYDLKTMYQVTLNGQLILLQLIELLSIQGAKCFYANTDGASFIVKRDNLEYIKSLAQQFADSIHIPIEFDLFKKCYIRDCNAFVIIKENGSFKLKGDYIYENLPLNKNCSNLISSKAATQYLINNTPFIKTIKEETNILPFCIGFRAQSTPKKGVPDITWFKDGDREFKEIQQKTVRYIVSNKGGVLKLVYNNGDEAHLQAHPEKDKLWQTQMLTVLQSKEAKDFDINFDYYQYEASKLCNFRYNVQQGQINQLSLF